VHYQLPVVVLQVKLFGIIQSEHVCTLLYNGLNAQLHYITYQFSRHAEVTNMHTDTHTKSGIIK
jgi:hypothetical protein